MNNFNRKENMKLKKLILPIIIGLVLFAGGFWTGTYYQKNHTNSKTADGAPSGFSKDSSDKKPTGTPPSGGNGGGQGGGGVSGEIISKTDDSLTIKTSDGSTKTVYYSSSTTISKNTTGSSSDLAVGTSVSVMGETNSDKSVTGKTIMIMPADATK